MDSLRLHILTPGGPLVDAAVSSVSLPGALGPFEVLPGHAPLLSPLRKGAVGYVEDGEAKTLDIAGGFVEVAADTIDVCAEI